jgi:hypothetical protein
MASLSTIPQELANDIFGQLSLKDMLALAKTSRALHDAVLPSLYNTHDLSWITSDLREGRDVTDALRSHSRSLRTFMELPTYATYVRYVVIKIPRGICTRKDDQKRLYTTCKLMDDEKLLFERAIEHLGMPNPEQ